MIPSFLVSILRDRFSELLSEGSAPGAPARKELSALRAGDVIEARMVGREGLLDILDYGGRNIRVRGQLELPPGTGVRLRVTRPSVPLEVKLEAVYPEEAGPRQNVPERSMVRLQESFSRLKGLVKSLGGRQAQAEGLDLPAGKVNGQARILLDVLSVSGDTEAGEVKALALFQAAFGPRFSLVLSDQVIDDQASMPGGTQEGPNGMDLSKEAPDIAPGKGRVPGLSQEGPGMPATPTGGSQPGSGTLETNPPVSGSSMEISSTGREVPSTGGLALELDEKAAEGAFSSPGARHGPAGTAGDGAGILPRGEILSPEESGGEACQERPNLSPGSTSSAVPGKDSTAGITTHRVNGPPEGAKIPISDDGARVDMTRGQDRQAARPSMEFRAAAPGETALEREAVPPSKAVNVMEETFEPAKKEEFSRPVPLEKGPDRENTVPGQVDPKVSVGVPEDEHAVAAGPASGLGSGKSHDHTAGPVLLREGPGPEGIEDQASSGKGALQPRGGDVEHAVVREFSNHVELSAQLQHHLLRETGLNLFVFPFLFASMEGTGQWSFWREEDDESSRGEGQAASYHIAFDLYLRNMGQLNIHLFKQDENLNLFLAAEKKALPVIRQGLSDLSGRIRALGFRFENITCTALEDGSGSPVSPAIPGSDRASRFHLVT